MSLRRIVLIVVLAIAAVASWFLSRPGADTDSLQAVQETPYRGYYLKSARILGTGPTGKLVY